MATITNTTAGELEVPSIGAVFAPGETKDVGVLSDEVAATFAGHGVLLLEGHEFADPPAEQAAPEAPPEEPPVVEEPAPEAPAVEGTVE